MRTKVNGFTTPIHYAVSRDELRPILNYVHFKDDYAWATDAHIAVKIPLSRFGFTKEEKALLNGYSISANQFILIKNKELLIQESGEIRVPELGVSVHLRKTDEVQNVKLLADLQTMMANNDKGEVCEIAFNPRHLKRIHDAIGSSSLKLRFISANRHIMIESNSSDHEGEGLLMPTMING